MDESPKSPRIRSRRADNRERAEQYRHSDTERIISRDESRRIYRAFAGATSNVFESEMSRQAELSIEVGLRGTKFADRASVSSVEQGGGELVISIECIMSAPRDRIVAEFRRRVGSGVVSSFVPTAQPFGVPNGTILLTISDKVKADYTRSRRVEMFTSSAWFKLAMVSMIVAAVSGYHLHARLNDTYDPVWWALAMWRLLWRVVIMGKNT